jgi:chromosome segregation ATPase
MSLQELENQKVSLEMKTVDLEEQVDILTKEKAELQEEIEVMSHMNQAVEERATDWSTAITGENDSDKSNLFQSLEMVERREEKEEEEEEKQLQADGVETKASNKSLDQLKVELFNSSRIIEDQKEIIVDLKSKIDSRDEELEMQNEIIAKLERLSGDYNDRDDRIAEIVKELNEVAGDLEEWKTRCTEVEKRLQDLGDEKMELEERFKEVKSENSLLNQELAEQKEIAADLALKLKEQSNAITGRDERISSLQNLIEINGQTLEAREMTLKDVHEKLNSVEKQYELRQSELKMALLNKEKELVDMTTALAKQENTLKEKETQIMRLGETLQKQSQEFAFLQHHVSTIEENISHQFRAQLDEISVALADKDQLNRQLAEECQQHRLQIETLTAELSDKVQYIKKLEAETQNFKEVEMQLQSAVSNLKSCKEELSTLKQDLALKHSELEEKMDKLKQVEGKVMELTEKNKKFIANLKAKAIAIKGHEQKIQQYEAVVQAKEKLISELTAQNEKLLEHQADEARASNLEQQLKTIDILTRELNEEQSRTELIGDELAKATEKIVSLESELKASEAKVQEMSSIEEACVALTTKVSELEQEISVIQMEIRNKDDRIMLLEEDKVRLAEEGKAKEEEEEKKSSALKDKIRELETELAKQTTEKVEKLEAEKSELLQQVLSSSSFSAKISELEKEVSSRDQRIAELQEQVISHERNQQSLSAVEAKLQEREAVVESLEQDLSKAMERVQHLEEGLAFAEERRQSLVNKAEVLNVRLQESDRVKEEAVENEEMLEQHLTALIASEESLKKKLDVSNRGNEESSQKIAELTAENVELRKEITNMESNVKVFQKELERLTPFEHSFMQASAKVETLEAELKRVVLELEHRMKEKVQELQQHAENLETDLRNVNLQLEHVELEKRTLMEQYEKLNDEKMNLEDEVEKLNEALGVYIQTNSELRKELEEKLFAFESTISEKEVARKELEERVQFLEAEIENKTSAYNEKQCVNRELNEKIQLLEGELEMLTSTVNTVTSEKEEIKSKLNERVSMLEKELEGTVSSFESASSEKDRICSELQEKIEYQEAELKRYQCIVEAKMMQPSSETDSNVSRKDSEECVSNLNAELDHLKSVLTQKDNEIKSYQTRLLQLQFVNVPDSGHDSQASLQVKMSHLENSNTELQETVHIKEAQILDLSIAAAASSTELGQLRSELESYQGRVEELMKQVSILQEEAMNKNNYIQQLQITLAETQVQVPPQLDSIAHEYEAKLSSLEGQNDELFKELLKMKAQKEVADIVRVAEECVQNMNVMSEDSNYQSKSVTFEEPLHKQPVFTEMEGQIKALEEELQFVRTERDEALLRITELTSRVPPSSGDTALTLEECGAEMSSVEVDKPWQQMSRSENVFELEPFTGKDSLVGAVPRVMAPETVLEFGSSSWDVGVEGEEEGWGWGSDEVQLEEEHIQKQQENSSCSEPSNVLNDRIATLENHIKDVEAEKEKLGEELHAAQVRSGKLLKKLKDLKLKNDNLLKENMELAKRNGEKNFGDLDQAIEEELKIRIDTLETEIREVRNERDTAYAEKERLENRVDMLTCTNERLVEMKERQDMDIEVWKQRNRDLSNQVQSLEWRVGELLEETKSVMQSDKVGEQGEKDSFFSWDKHSFTSDNKGFINMESTNDELQDKLAALSADNENLQGLLEQQRNLRLSAEAELQEIQQRVLQMENKSSEIECLTAENNGLKEQLHVATQHKTLEELKRECDRLEEKNSDLQNAYYALKTEYGRMCRESEECVLATEKKYEVLQFDYTKKIEDVCNEKIKIEEHYRNVLNERDRLAQDFQKLTTDLAALTQQHEALKLEYSNIREHLSIQEKTLAFANEQKNELEHELAQLKSQIVSDSLESSGTSALLSEQQVRIAEVETELRAKTKEIEMLCQLIESQKLEQAQIEQEWNGKVERLRKELEYNVEELRKQQDSYSILMKEYQELRDHSGELIQCHIQETLNAKEQEIEHLKAQLAEKETQFVLQFEQQSEEELKCKLNESSELLSARDKDIESLKTRLTEKENEIERIFSVKDKDIQNLKIILSEKEHQFEELLGQKYNLQAMLSEKDARINELLQTLDEEAKQLTELRELLEDRELQLRQSKDELLVTRSKEVEAVSVLPKQPQDSFPSSLTDENLSLVEDSLERRGQKDDSSAEAQQRELDLALYMLHQRDVRCDELTLELMQVRILIQHLESYYFCACFLVHLMAFSQFFN